ncbi:subtype II CRISPR-associated endonuclease Cas1 [Liquorilactobacillus hordei]|uniref:CRISPR-associated endonuclease Cas1 n=2 Tax=Liquorilactobacillus hordei TaxID=468911 RepID=A0A3Q8CMH8_9LACO|nr:subtype II CRISPR-associated endonuclease Cas1 [Liquorilactobacillus hordei]
MTWRNIMVKDGDYLRLKLDNLQIEKAGQKYIVPLSDIATITLEGKILTLTTRLLSKFAQYNIAVIVCDNKYVPCGIYMGFGQYHRTAKRNLEQVAWSSELRKEVWTKIIQQKMINQKAVLSAYEVDTGRVDKMQELIENIQFADITNREGHAAKVYFNSLYGKYFTRERECLENGAMNYGYTIIRAYMARLVTSLGLIPTLGVFHRNEFNSFNLVDDLMEPFRPLMDWYILDKILPSYPKYLSWDIRCELIDFLNQPYIHKGRKTTIDLVMLEYVNSFIKMMQGKKKELLVITLEEMRGVQ